MNISVINQQTDLNIDEKSVEEVVKEFLKFAKIKCDEVTLYYVSTPEICQLHADHFNDPSTTDCISFPMDDEEEMVYRVLGEVFVCPQTAIDYVKNQGEDSYQEVTLYTIHGLLHLIGYDDIDPEDELEMREQETRAMQHLLKKGLLIHQKI